MFSDVQMYEDSLKEKLRDFAHLLIIGVGNELGCDDAAGIELSRQMKREFRRSRKVSIIEAGTTPENSTSIIRRLRPSHILIVDAAQMGLPPGSVRIIERSEIGGFGFSTHSLPLSLLIDYLEKNSQAIVVLVGIEPLDVGFGKKLSKPIAKSIGDLIGILRKIIKSVDCGSAQGV
jgi:hydrogenase 3 maturation protease